MEKNKYRHIVDDHIKKIENLEPIYKGCRNKMCFCTGDCKTIIGYREKTNYDFR